MSTNDDANPGIYWTHCAAGMHLGKMEPRPLTDEFGAVLTLAAASGKVDKMIRHRHLPMSYVTFDVNVVIAAIDWVGEQVEAGRTVLVRSEGGLQRPGLVIAGVCVRLGATASEAVWCVRRDSSSQACTDFRYVRFISHFFAALR